MQEQKSDLTEITSKTRSNLKLNINFIHAVYGYNFTIIFQINFKQTKQNKIRKQLHTRTYLYNTYIYEHYI